MDGIDQVRAAGAIVEILKVLGYSKTDITAITKAISAHLAVEEKDDTQLEAPTQPPAGKILVASRN